MDKKSSQKRREYTESSSSSEAENAPASKAAKPAFSWTKYERRYVSLYERYLKAICLNDFID